MILKKGFFITFEGPECAGKTTQIRLLERHLKELGRRCLLTREPGGTEIGEQLRHIVKHHTGRVSDETEVLLFAASRAQHVTTVIRPAVESGTIVICDRFMDSTTAYQGCARALNMDFIARLNRFAVSGCVPDLTILMDLAPEESARRSRERETPLGLDDRIESETIDFHRKVRNGFLEIARAEPERVKVVDAANPIESVRNEIALLVDDAIRSR
jgi:dTMP kinase